MAYTKIERSQELLGLGLTPKQIQWINRKFDEKPNARICIMRLYKANIGITATTVTLRFKRPTHSRTT